MPKSLDPKQVSIEEGNLIRESTIAELSRRGGTIDGGDRALLDPARRRIDFQGRRPVICGSQTSHLPAGQFRLSPASWRRG